MPRGDGTGPMGVGPNGWGRGGCLGFGPMGGGSGFGRGMRWRQAMPYQAVSPDAESLEERAGMLERQAAACREMARKARNTGAKTE